MWNNNLNFKSIVVRVIIYKVFENTSNVIYLPDNNYLEFLSEPYFM